MISVALKEAQKMGSVVQRTLPKNSPKPILNGVLVQVDENGKVYFSTHNGMSGFRAETESVDLAQPLIEGFVILNGERFLNFLKAAEGDDLTMTRKDNQVVLKVGKTKTQLPASDIQDYPQFPMMINYVAFPGFLYGLSKAHLFSRGVASVPHEGVHIIVQDGRFVIEATSGREAARIQGDVERENSEWIMTASDARDLCSIFPAESTVFVEQQGAFLLVSNAEGVTWATRLLAHNYPNLNIIFQITSEGQWKTSRSAFYGATKRALAIISDKDNKGAKLTFDQEYIRVLGKSPYGDVEELIAANYTGEKKEMGFDMSYLQHVLAQWDNDEVSADLFTIHNGHAMIIHNDHEQYILMGVLLR